ncbi:hypothetical protein GCM10008985_25560 [Halococcus dombrowskii]|uniref:Uncharacterized protein n=1 Tax=Halococcus dombrowskii TaxID=179637 RepID=A0AAV3SJP3_HALDO
MNSPAIYARVILYDSNSHPTQTLVRTLYARPISIGSNASLDVSTKRERRFLKQRLRHL